MMTYINLVISALHHLLLVATVVAVADHRGRHFVTSFLGLNSPLSPEILIVPQVKHGAVNVSIHSISGGVLTHRHLTVQPGTSRVVTVESGIRMIAGKLEKKGIEITSSEEIAVYTTNRAPYSNDAVLLTPIDALGNDYVITCQGIPANSNYVTSVGVVATFNSTVIHVSMQNTHKSSTTTVRHENTTYYSNKNEEFTVVLQKLETFQLDSNQGGDLTGIRMVSNQSFSVISVSTSSTPRIQHIEEQVVPYHAWGYSFIALPFSSTGVRKESNSFKITAAYNDTKVETWTAVGDLSMEEYVLESGKSLEVGLNESQEYLCIVSNKPISVLQYHCTYYSNSIDSICQPYLLTIPSLEQLHTEYIFSVAGESTNTYGSQIHLVINSSLFQGLLINGSSIESYPQTEIASNNIPVAVNGHNTNFTAIKLVLPPGTHNISHIITGAPFSAVSQASPLGMRMMAMDSGGKISEYNKQVFSSTYNIKASGNEQEIFVSDTNKIELMETSATNDGGSGSLPANVIAVIVTLTSAVFFVIVCILGFVVTETVCRRTSNKIFPS